MHVYIVNYLYRRIWIMGGQWLTLHLTPWGSWIMGETHRVFLLAKVCVCGFIHYIDRKSDWVMKSLPIPSWQNCVLELIFFVFHISIQLVPRLTSRTQFQTEYPYWDSHRIVFQHRVFLYPIRFRPILPGTGLWRLGSWVPESFVFRFSNDRLSVMTSFIYQ